MFAPAHFGVRELAPAFPAAANRNQREKPSALPHAEGEFFRETSQMEQ